MLQTGKIFVYKIPKPSASKITEIINGKNQRRLNQTKVDGRIKERFQPGLSAKTRKLATGLDKEVDNPYKGQEIANPNFQFLKNQEKALLQHIIECKFNLVKDSLHNAPVDPHKKDK